MDAIERSILCATPVSCGGEHLGLFRHLSNSLCSISLRPRCHLYLAAPSSHNDDNSSSAEVNLPSSSNRSGVPDIQSKQPNLTVQEGSVEKPSTLPYGLITGLAAVGLAETCYLTWMKLYGGPVSCPLGGTSCSDVLNSDYATLFGVPLSLLGVVAYGAVTLLGGRMVTSPSYRARQVDGLARWLLLGSTTAMAVSSTYFMYILTTKLEGASCSYCVASALLSLSLLLSTLRGFTSRDVLKVAGLQLAVGGSVVVALSVAFADANSTLARLADIDLPFLEPVVSTVSSPKEISLAKHLQSLGAKMYGAFWCSHCLEQKEMFGQEAMKYVDYIECYPEGFRKGVKIATACDAAKIEGFPTWIINGQTLSGEQNLSQLAEASGLDIKDIPK